ncbi:MAG: phosphoribosyl-ATP diphosphatase [Clostridiaceae bacterium]|nr:phosphoribosyl-ATP diphosphatase [Clostridiales bacterium]MDD6877971.1 phosphoribosyl-ATP diphosphatase [Clostridiaceae bacterium]MDY3285376.1 phosphoribosyl-ATP diphosphatase [Eubacteriales bacterium]MDY5015103.1 phosphoribosyl-ATP diphosphatase [Eubacteriales bacterium]
MESLENLYKVVCGRRENPQEGSYTCYLFEQGLDKICKKIGEESAELIIASKNGVHDEVQLEACDLLYHLMVLLVQTGVPLSDIDAELARRAEKIGNLKTMKKTDKET